MTPTEARLLLSDREFEAARLAKQGLKVNEIAEILNTTMDAARKYIGRAKKKLGNDYQNSPIFGNTERSVLLYPKIWKTESGKDVFQRDILYGRASMAYGRYGNGEVYLDAEARLAHAINFLGDRKYLHKKRREVRNALVLSTRYHVVKLPRSMLSDAVKSVIAQNKLKVIKTDLPGLEKDDTLTKSYLCKTGMDYSDLMKTIIGKPQLEYCPGLRKISVGFGRPVYVEYLRIKVPVGRKHELLTYKKFFLSQAEFELDASLESGKMYVVNLQIGCGGQLDYDMKVSTTPP